MATGGHRRRGCRRKYRSDALRAARSWRRREAPCAPLRAGPPGPRCRSGCDRRPWGDRFSLARALSAASHRLFPGAKTRRWTQRINASARRPAAASLLGYGRWRLLLPGASEPRLRLLRPQDFRSVFQTALRGLGNRSIVVVGNYECGPVTVEPCRAKARPLRPRRSYFAPVTGSRCGNAGNLRISPDLRSPPVP